MGQVWRATIWKRSKVPQSIWRVNVLFLQQWTCILLIKCNFPIQENSKISFSSSLAKPKHAIQVTMYISFIINKFKEQRPLFLIYIASSAKFCKKDGNTRNYLCNKRTSSKYMTKIVCLRFLIINILNYKPCWPC